MALGFQAQSLRSLAEIDNAYLGKTKHTSY